MADEKAVLSNTYRIAVQLLLDSRGWSDVDPDDLIAPAVEGIAWALIDASMDTADREVTEGVLAEATATAWGVLEVLTQQRFPPEQDSSPEADRG